MAKNKKDTVVTDSNTKQVLPIYGIYGFAMAFVLVSIISSSYIVWVGTSDIIAKVLLAPQMLFGLTLLIYKFVK